MNKWTIPVMLLFFFVVIGCSVLGPKNTISPGSSEWFDRWAKVDPETGLPEVRETGGSTISPGFKGDDPGEFDNEGGSVGPRGSEHGGAKGAFAALKGLGTSLYLIGAGLVITAGLLGYFVSWKIGLLVGVGGLVGIAAIQFIESYAWIIGGVALVALVVLGYACYRVKRDGEDKKLTLGTIVAALESAGKEAADVVKAKIKELSKVNGKEGVVKDVVNKAKTGK